MKNYCSGYFWKGLLLVAAVFITGCAHQSWNGASEKRALLEKKNLQLAVQYLQANQPLKAITRLKKTLQINPGSAESYGLLGVIYQQQQEYALSENNFQKALALAPDNSSIRNNYGTLLYVSGRYEAAAKQFHQVSKDVYYESRDRVFENLGTTYLKMEKTEKAIGYYQHALRLNARLAKANLKLAEIYFIRNNIAKAHRYYMNFTATGRQSAESLWLGIRIAKRVNEDQQVSVYSGQLKKYHAHSEEFRQYQQWKTNQR